MCLLCLLWLLSLLLSSAHGSVRISLITLGRRPTVGPQTLDLLIGVRIPASQFRTGRGFQDDSAFGRHP